MQGTLTATAVGATANRCSTQNLSCILVCKIRVSLIVLVLFYLSFLIVIERLTLLKLCSMTLFLTSFSFTAIKKRIQAASRQDAFKREQEKNFTKQTQLVFLFAHIVRCSNRRCCCRWPKLVSTIRNKILSADTALHWRYVRWLYTFWLLLLSDKSRLYSDLVCNCDVWFYLPRSFTVKRYSKCLDRQTDRRRHPPAELIC